MHMIYCLEALIHYVNLVDLEDRERVTFEKAVKNSELMYFPRPFKQELSE